MTDQKIEQNPDNPILDDTIPHQINSPSFKNTPIKMKAPFVNEHGIVIGDSLYQSKDSPLNQWSTEIDPAIMAGKQWVHPTNDIGWNSPENRALLEENTPSQGVPFTHPTKDASYMQD